MSVLFRAKFNDVLIHVLHIRGRTAFLATELGAAAGYSDGGQGLVDQIVREWAPSFDEDDDLAQVVGAELEQLKREVPLPPTTTMALVLFTTGAERALQRARVRHARALLGFMHAEVLSRVISLGGGAGDGGEGGAPANAPPPFPSRKRGAAFRMPTAAEIIAVGGELNKLLAGLNELAENNRETADVYNELQRQVHGYEALTRLAVDLRTLGLISNIEYAALRVEAVELLLGRPIETPLPPFHETAQSAAA